MEGTISSYLHLVHTQGVGGLYRAYTPSGRNLGGHLGILSTMSITHNLSVGKLDAPCGKNLVTLFQTPVSLLER